MGKKTINRKSKFDKKSKKAIKLINKLTKEISTLSKSEYKKVSKDLIRLTGRKPIKMNKKVLKRTKGKKTKRGRVKSGTYGQPMPGQPMPGQPMPGQPMAEKENRTFLGMDLTDAKERVGWNIIDGLTWGSGFVALGALSHSLMSDH